jgi:hypothetical protein
MSFGDSHGESVTFLAKLVAGRWALAAIVTVFAAAAGCGSSDENRIREVVVEHASTIVAAASGLLTRPYHITVDDAGRIYVVDGQNDRILTFEPHGHHIATLGRYGSGPGELRRPSGLWIRDDTLIIADAGNGRLQRWTPTGEYLSMTPLPREARRGVPISIWDSDKYLVATRGLDGTLAKLLGPTDHEYRTFGTPSVPHIDTLQPMRETIRAGQIPVMFQNIVLPFITDDHDVWLVPLGRPTVYRFDTLGVLLDSLPLPIPEQTSIEEAFFLANVANREPGIVITMRYVADALVVGDALWLLLNLPEEYPTTMLVIERGQVRDRIVFDAVRGAVAFAVDTAGRRVLFVQPDASVSAAPLP